MKLWLLRPMENLPGDDDPWKPWYDKVFGFVVRAKNELEARKLGDANADHENRGTFLYKKTSNTLHPWLDEKYASCTELTNNGEPGVVIAERRET